MTGWLIVSGPEVVAPAGDHHRFSYALARGDENRAVVVEISGTAMACDHRSLPSPVDDDVRSHGRSAVERYLDRVEPPAKIVVSTSGAAMVARRGFYEPRDRLLVRENDEWIACEFVDAGDPDDAEVVADTRVVGGTRRRDVAWVRLASTGEIVSRRYDLLRPA